MPKVNVLFNDSYNSITWPVLRDISKDVIKLCGLSDNTPLFINGERGTTNQPGSELFREDEVRFGSTNQVYCEVEERYSQEELLTAKIRERNDSHPVIADYDLGLFIRPTYIKNEITFNFKYIAASMNAATRWRDELLMRMAETRTSHQHTLMFDLYLNDDILALINHIYQLKENISGNGETFTDYFNRIKRVDFHLKGTRDGDVNKSVMTTSLRQARVYGHFEGGVPTENRVDSNITYEVDFTYKIGYHKPIAWYIDYPLVVHQQHINPELVDMNVKYALTDLDYSQMDSGIKALDKVTWRTLVDHNVSFSGLRYPYYDEWPVVEDTLPWSLPIANWLLSIDPSKPQHLIDLNKLPDMEFTKVFKSFLLDSVKGLTFKGGSSVRFTLYQGLDALDGSLIEVSDDLIISSKKPLDLTKVYHIRLSFVTSANELSATAYETLRKHPIAALEIFQTMFPLLDVEWAMKYGISNFQLSDQYIEWVYYEAENRGYGQNGFKRSRRKVFKRDLPEVLAVREVTYNDDTLKEALQVKDSGESRKHDYGFDLPEIKAKVNVPFELDIENIDYRDRLMSPNKEVPKFTSDDIYTEEDVTPEGLIIKDGVIYNEYGEVQLHLSIEGDITDWETPNVNDDRYELEDIEIPNYNDEGEVGSEESNEIELPIKVISKPKDQISNLPIMNNSLNLKTTQYLSIFTRKR